MGGAISHQSPEAGGHHVLCRFSLTRQSVFLAVVAAALALPGAAALAQDVPVAGTPVRVIPADAPMARMVMAMPTASTP